jgi:hypothetical protein
MLSCPARRCETDKQKTKGFRFYKLHPKVSVNGWVISTVIVFLQKNCFTLPTKPSRFHYCSNFALPRWTIICQATYQWLRIVQLLWEMKKRRLIINCSLLINESQAHFYTFHSKAEIDTFMIIKRDHTKNLNWSFFVHFFTFNVNETLFTGPLLLLSPRFGISFSRHLWCFLR